MNVTLRAAAPCDAAAIHSLVLANLEAGHLLPRSIEDIRDLVARFFVAERQGQVAAKNMIGIRERYDAVPFFWSQHYDVAINYVGHAERWDAIDIDGRLEARDCTVTYKRGGRALAVATIGRDRTSLAAELKMERKTAFQAR